eukprot:1155359-Pelagomonas_calceolata.AAC.5
MHLASPSQANLRGQIEREKALGEAEGRAKEARENEDINRRAALLRYQEEVGLWGFCVFLQAKMSAVNKKYTPQ